MPSRPVQGEMQHSVFLFRPAAGTHRLLLVISAQTHKKIYPHVASLDITHPPAFFFIHPHPSFLYQLPRAGLWGESFWGRVRNCINYSCLVLWPQGQRCQSRLGPQQWCIAAIKKKEEKGKPLLLAASVQLLLICTNNSVTSAHGRTGSDSFIQLHHVPAWLQANPG